MSQLSTRKPSVSLRATIGGDLGEAIQRSREARLRTFIVDETSEPLAIFAEEFAAHNRSGDWYGEHVGKWLLAVMADGDAELADRAKRVASWLAGRQEPSGYLGTYAADAPSRFTSPDAESVRTWDLWVHAYVILGLLVAGEQAAAMRAGDLIASTFENRRVSAQGNHGGLSSTVILEALSRLAVATGSDRALEAAAQVADELADAAGPGLVSKLAAGDDIASVATGKIYQLIWNLSGLLALDEACGSDRYRSVVEAGWESIARNHLTLGGGPWGGVAGHKEVFNLPGYFSPYGMVETCSAMAWMQLSHELLTLTGDPRYADAIESTAWNSLLGAMDENGSDWSYFTFPNGRRNSTYSWACCKSSGALALARLYQMVARETAGTTWIDLYASGTSIMGGGYRISMATDYPRSGRIQLTVDADHPRRIALRIPSWVRRAELSGPSGAQTQAYGGGYLTVDLPAGESQSVTLDLDFGLRVNAQSATLEHHSHEVMRHDYAGLTWGPLVLATGLVDGYKHEETIKLPRLSPEAVFTVEPGPGLHVRLRRPGQGDIVWEPYYLAGGRSTGETRLTWLGVAWQ